MENGLVIWSLLGLSLADPPAAHAASRLTFRLDKGAALDQRDLFPASQTEPTTDYALTNPLRGEERWGGQTRPVTQDLGRFPLHRVFLACPEPAAFVADTTTPPALDLRWCPMPASQGQGARPALEFRADLQLDPAPDRRWREPRLEIELPDLSYANILAALRAIG